MQLFRVACGLAVRLEWKMWTWKLWAGRVLVYVAKAWVLRRSANIRASCRVPSSKLGTHTSTLSLLFGQMWDQAPFVPAIRWLQNILILDSNGLLRLINILRDSLPRLVDVFKVHILWSLKRNIFLHQAIDIFHYVLNVAFDRLSFPLAQFLLFIFDLMLSLLHLCFQFLICLFLLLKLQYELL